MKLPGIWTRQSPVERYSNQDARLRPRIVRGSRHVDRQ
jgi:hypothetical protein